MKNENRVEAERKKALRRTYTIKLHGEFGRHIMRILAGFNSSLVTYAEHNDKGGDNSGVSIDISPEMSCLSCISLKHLF